ncbi:MAG: RES family NAD+ phosphorylase [Shimia sp.]
MQDPTAAGRPFVTRWIEDRPLVRLVRRHHPSATGVGWGASRFVPDPGSLPPPERFRALYAASDLTTAFAETVLRDAAVDRPNRYPLGLDELNEWDVAELRADGLAAVDLTGPHLVAARVPTDAVRALDQSHGQTLGLEVHGDSRAFDGILYPSRLTGAKNLAVFERAIQQHVTAISRRPLLGEPGFAAVLDDLAVVIA